jgi:hypothetical protein
LCLVPKIKVHELCEMEVLATAGFG